MVKLNLSHKCQMSCLPDRLKKPFVFNFLKSLNRKALLLSQCLDNLRYDDSSF